MFVDIVLFLAYFVGFGALVFGQYKLLKLWR
jgi:hypothetical protein